jgi:hypothetical protein
MLKCTKALDNEYLIAIGSLDENAKYKAIGNPLEAYATVDRLIDLEYFVAML